MNDSLSTYLNFLGPILRYPSRDVLLQEPSRFVESRLAVRRMEMALALRTVSSHEIPLPVFSCFAGET